MNIKTVAAVAALMGLGVVTAPAYAGVCTSGFLADAACILGFIDEDTARQADRIHRGMGSPLNQLNPFEQGGRGSGPMGPGMPMGNFCHTPAGRFGPGPWNPVGSYCWANTPWGPVDGSVGR